MAGWWEFPGARWPPAKVIEALVRELREELGVETRAEGEIMTLTHDYPDRTIDLVYGAPPLPAACRIRSMGRRSSGWTVSHSAMNASCPPMLRSSVPCSCYHPALPRNQSHWKSPWPRNSSSPKSSSTRASSIAKRSSRIAKPERCDAWRPSRVMAATIRLRGAVLGPDALLTPAGVLPLAFELEASSPKTPATSSLTP
jgi:hypothetical protein